MKATSSARNDSEGHSNDSQADAVLHEWRDSAFYWQKHLDMIRVMFAPLTQALIDDAGIIEGDSVLDVAGGSGTLREKLATLPPSQADLLAQEALKAIREYSSNNQVSIPAQMIVVTAQKP